MGRIATMRAVRRIGDAVSRNRPPRTSPYDASATVTAVDGGTAWVLLDGAGEPMPVTMTIDSKPGDRVRVRVSSSGAHVTGNATAPPTDDAEAIAAKVRAQLAKDAADTAQTTAESAQETADAAAERVEEVAASVKNYVWANDEGLHITQTEGAVVAGESNMLLDSNSMDVRAGNDTLASYGASGFQIGKSDGNHLVGDSNGIEVQDGYGVTLATFGQGVLLGDSTNGQVSIDSNGFTVYDSDGVNTFNVYDDAIFFGASETGIEYIHTVAGVDGANLTESGLMVRTIPGYSASPETYIQMTCADTGDSGFTVSLDNSTAQYPAQIAYNLDSNGDAYLSIQGDTLVDGDMAATGEFAAGSIVPGNTTAGRAVITGSNGELATSSVTSTELYRLSGVTGNVQNQIDAAKTTATVQHVTATLTATIAANGSASGTLQATIPTGYTPVGVMCSALSNAFLMDIRVLSVNTSGLITYYVRNTSTSSAITNGTATFVVACVKTG